MAFAIAADALGLLHAATVNLGLCFDPDLGPAGQWLVWPIDDLGRAIDGDLMRVMVAFVGLDGQDGVVGAVLPVGLYHMLIDMNDGLHTKNVHFVQKMSNHDWKKLFLDLLFL